MTQTVPADEIIVVDNNSTDATAQIVRRYPGVQLIHEPRQGLVFARNAGMEAANGDILARIDADAYVATQWVERLHEVYADPAVMAAGGPGKSVNLQFVGLGKSTVWSRAYLFGAQWVFNVPILWGSNMSMRRESWHAISPALNADGNQVHEDQDISLVLAQHHQKVIIDSKLIVTASPAPEKYSAYMARLYRTRMIHKKRATLQMATKRYGTLKRIMVFFVCIIPLKVIFIIGWLAGFGIHELMRSAQSTRSALRVWHAID